MRFAIPGCRALLVLCLVQAAAPHRSLAGGVEACGAHADTGQTAQAEPLITRFYPHRQGTPRTDLTARDLEFLWDSLYVVGFTANVRSTLDRLNQALVFTQGASPIALNGTNLQVLYNYFRTQGADWNPINPRDSLSFRIGRNTDGTYNNADRDHADYYVRHPSRPSVREGSDTEGSYPASETTLDEDISTAGRSHGDYRRANSISVVGPSDAEALDLAGTGWTAVNARRRALFNHELKHGMPGGDNGEFWSAAAEVVGGITDTTAAFEVPYTWPVVSLGTGVSYLCTQANASFINRRALSNYQGRTAFMAYVAYNFLGADTSRTLQGMTDDLLFKWSKGMSPHSTQKWGLIGLSQLLRDSLCATCAGKGYFHPGGQSLDDRRRFNVLHHNWRVANFVNNPSVSEGELGYQTWSGFSPARSQKAWQTFDNCGYDDIVAIPGVVTVGSRQQLRDTTIKNFRAYRGAEYPLNLAPFGSNYWVVRADPAMPVVTQDLVIRVYSRTAFRGLRSNGQVVDSRALLVSAIGYARVDTSADEPNLWRYPSAVSYISGIQMSDVDSVESAVELTVPSFGSTQKAVLLVLTSGDGPPGKLVTQTQVGQSAVSYDESQPYRLEIGLRASPYMAVNPLPVSTIPTYGEGAGTWSPSGDEVAYMALDPSVAPVAQIYRRRLDGSAAQRVAPQTGSQYEPDWSPRGDVLAFESATSPSQSNLWITHPTNGSNLQELTTRPGIESAPSFQPDGQGLAYLHLPPDSVRWQVRYVRVNGTGDRLLGTIGFMDGVHKPRWTPDGTRVYVSSVERGDSVIGFPKATGSPSPAGFVGGFMKEFDFHPGRGRLLAVSVNPLENSGNGINETTVVSAPPVQAIRVGLFDTTTTARDTSFRFASRTQFFDNPRWSPEGTRVLFDQVSGTDRDFYVQQVTWNRAPTFNQYVGDQTLTACQPFSMSLAATDPDNEPITILTYGLPAGAVMSGTNMLWVRPPAGTFYTIFKAIDGSGGVASKVVRFTVAGSCGGFLSAGSGGGSGGGTSSRGAERTSALPGQTAVEGNSLLDGAEPGTWVSQLARVATTAADQVSLTVTAGNSGTATLDQARLIVFDHPEGTAAISSNAGPVVISNLTPALATNSDGSPIALEPDGQLTQPVVVPAGTVVTLNWAAGSLPQGLSLDCQRPGPAEWGEDAGVDVQVNSGGQWTSVGRVFPRSESDRLAIPLAGFSTARLVFQSDVLVNGFAGYAVDAQATASAVTTTAAVAGSSHEAAVAALAAADGPSLALGSGEQLTLDFTGLPELAAGRTRSVFLDLRARHEGGAGGATARQRDGNAIPIRFALHQNLPNPFGRGTSIRFDVPRATDVRLEIFDAQGRRVRTLADRAFEPGSHVVAWDGRDDGGRLLGASVYLCRMAAGEFRQFRTMVMVP